MLEVTEEKILRQEEHFLQQFLHCISTHQNDLGQKRNSVDNIVIRREKEFNHGHSRLSQTLLQFFSITVLEW